MIAKAVTPILNVSDMAASFAWFEKPGKSESHFDGTESVLSSRDRLHHVHA